MMAAGDASTPEEEDGVDEEEGQKGTAASSADSKQDRLALAANYAMLITIDSLLIAPMILRKGEKGIGTCECVRICVITKGKISLSHVVVSQ